MSNGGRAFQIGLVCVLFSACAPLSSHEIVPGHLHVSLVAILAHPAMLPDGQPVVVRGFLANPTNLGLFLSAEHAGAEDVLSAIGLSDTIKGEITRSGCLNNFVQLTATFRRRNDEIFLARPTRVVVLSPSPGDYVAHVCWEATSGAA